MADTAISSPNAPQLPLEVWALVVEHLSTEDLKMLLLLNRAFYELGMDRLYHSIVISPDSSMALQIITFLGLFPHVASRVQALYVWPEGVKHIQYIIPKKRGFSRFLPSWIKPRHIGSAKSLQHLFTEHGIKWGPEMVLDIQNSAIHNLINVKELSIASTSIGVCPLLRALLPRVSGKLVTLTLFMYVTWFDETLMIYGHIFRELPSLVNLELCLSNRPYIGTIRINHILKFFATLPPTIEKLTIFFIEKCEGSPLLTNLLAPLNLPRLAKLSISFPMNTHISPPDPSSFNRLLRCHKSLTYLSITGRSCVSTFPKHDMRFELLGYDVCTCNRHQTSEALWNWYMECIRDINFESLETLELQLGHFNPFDEHERPFRWISSALETARVGYNDDT
ncbi:hypothetical protein H0H87_005343 [Tephrocybe sp. NHM501043]|nr:hypothetical protein H0H87_005343 [Tephrocybe sp. NHM501043]